MAFGRPTKYNEKLADLICQRVATHSCGLNKLCEMYDDMPARNTVNEWRYKYNDFSVRYAKAKLLQADLLAEECVDIADDSTNDVIVDEEGRERINSEFVNRARLRIDTRKWLAGKLLPKQYGKAAEEVPSENKDSVIDKLIEKLADK